MEWTKREPVTEPQVRALMRSLPSSAALLIDFGNIDYALGRGVGEGHSRCLWTKKGQRIDIVVASDGGIIASQTREPDPDRPKDALPNSSET